MKILKYTFVLFLGLLVGIFPLTGHAQNQPEKYKPTVKSLKEHQAPEWYRDAKLGIFIHWGLYSVPGWATTKEAPEGEAYKYHHYAEWYLNTLRIKGSPTQKYHYKHYSKDFGYYDFAKIFDKKIKQWNPDKWADLFKKVHARYVVLTSKHHDGFLLWPSTILDPYLPKGERHASRDIVGELAKAVRKVGLRFGLYYSGGFDWSFKPIVIHNSRTFKEATPQSIQYANYADEQWMELITKYHPAILWNDITYPKRGDAYKIFAYYYNHVPDGVINDRWGRPVYDFTTPEYSTYDSIVTQKWETTRGIALSFGYNRNSTAKQMLSINQLVEMFVDIVSKGGNLLLDVGPKVNGTIPKPQRRRLIGLGKWLDTNGKAIFGTRPWLKAQSKTMGGTSVRYTYKKGKLYVILLQKPQVSEIVIPKLIADPRTELRMLGYGGQLQWSNDSDGLHITLPGNLDYSPAYTITFSKQPALKMKK